MKYVVFVFLLLPTYSLANSTEKLYDLGSVSIEGEVRRPMVHLVKKKQAHQAYLKLVLEEELRAFESELLKPNCIDCDKRKSNE